MKLSLIAKKFVPLKLYVKYDLFDNDCLKKQIKSGPQKRPLS
jgi:hypothetical protein